VKKICGQRNPTALVYIGTLSKCDPLFLPTPGLVLSFKMSKRLPSIYQREFHPKK
jgi:hypothetical protein